MKLTPINKQHILEYKGKPFEKSMRGFAALHDGKVVGIAGVLHTEVLQAFSEFSDEVANNKRFIVQAIREFRKLLTQYDEPVFAAPDATKSTACGFLKHIGFKKQGELYRWQQQQ